MSLASRLAALKARKAIAPLRPGETATERHAQAQFDETEANERRRAAEPPPETTGIGRAPWSALEGQPAPRPTPTPDPTLTPGVCKWCKAPTVLAGGFPWSPDTVRAIPAAEVQAQRLPKPPGDYHSIRLASGQMAWGYLSLTGSLEGRLSHWITCTTTARQRQGDK